VQKLLQNAVLPITTGIFAAASYAILHAVIHSPLGLLISVVTLVATLRTRIHPLILLALGGLIGSCTRL
jgi:chromate transporter